MLKFIRGKYQPSAERLKLQKELFEFKRGLHHGFPSKPSAVAWEPELRYLALGTKSGAIKLYGGPGVEFYGQHESDSDHVSVTQLLFLPSQGRLISLLEDNSLHLWELNEHDDGWLLEEIKSVQLEGKLKKISCCCLLDSATELLIGTEGGNIYLLDVSSFQISETIIYQDVVMQNVPGDYKVTPGAVECIAQQPADEKKILIGYNRGLMVLWDRVEQHADQTYVSSQQLEGVSWLRGGKEFYSCHNDGSYIQWSSTKSESLGQPETPYGPYPCKTITKILSKTSKRGNYLIYGGGMPRAQFAEKNCVTVTRGDDSVAFDFTSKLVDFLVICDNQSDSDTDNPIALVVLVEEELLVIDLVSANWPVFTNPYLASLHCSAITCTHLATNVSDEFFQKIQTAGEKQVTSSTQPWPITGGSCEFSEDLSEGRSILLTGHEDGSVRFWSASGPSLNLMYTLKTSRLYEPQPEQDDEEQWPPFRTVGCFDPYSDDPRFAVQKLALCPTSGTLLIAGTAGQVILSHFDAEESEKKVELHPVNIVSDRDNFVWKGHEQLTLTNPNEEDDNKEEVEKDGVYSYKFASGFQPNMIIQITPPAAITAVALHPEWGLVAAGTAHGFGLFDYVQKKTVLMKCTLNPNDLTGAGDGPMSRRKSLKKSLRESFRRLRKGRSQRNMDRKGKASEANKGITSPTSTSPRPADMKPVERQIEARSPDDAMGSMVRCLYFAHSFIISGHPALPTFWVGTNSGTIYIYTVALAKGDKRKEEAVGCTLAKEIQLKHRAPVIAVHVVDANNKPLDKESDKLPHQVLICSEEQFKMFTLPQLKPHHKFKLTAMEGARVRRIRVVKFTSAENSEYSEYCISCMTNQGDVLTVSIPDLRKQISAHVTRREDINGISTMVFSDNGEGLYLHSPSELQRITVSKKVSTHPVACVELPEGVRPKKELPAEKEEEKTESSAAEPMVNGDAEPEESAPAEESKGEITTQDITIDSIKDHLNNLNMNDSSVISSSEITKEIKSEKIEESTTIVKTTTILATTEVAAVDGE